MFRKMKDKSPSSLLADRSGSIMIPFGLAIAVISTGIGGAIDFSRWHTAKRVTADAVDAAVLAGARALQLNPGTPQVGIDAANAYFQGNMAGRTDLAVNTLSFVVVDDNQAITATGDAAIDATFLRLIGIEKLSIFTTATSVYPKAKIIFGGQGGSNLEIALMLDVTGSMCDDGVGPCTSSMKLDGLKTAAKHLVDTVIPENQSGTYTSRMAIVPFSTRVRVGQDGGGGVTMRLLTDLNPTWSGYVPICTSWSGGGGSEGNGNWICNASEVQYQTAWKVMPCVTDRFYNAGWAYDYTDDAPGSARWLNAHDGGRRTKSWDSSNNALTTELGLTSADPAYQWNYNWNGSCADVDNANEVKPLSNQKQPIKNMIDGLVAYGSTSGALGTAWAWYTLSPNWNGFWTGNSQPGSYADVTTIQENGRPLLRKVAILMSDGVFNTYRGWKDQDQQTVSNYAKQLCTNMKAQGIEIFTIGLKLDELSAAERLIAEDTLRSCGTDVSHFYATLNVEELQIAFQDIAYQLSGVALTR